MADVSLASGFIELCIGTSLNYLTPGCRILIEGQYLPVAGSGIVADEIIKVPSAGQVDGMFGKGSILSESLKIAFCACPANVDIYAIPRADAAGAVAAVYDMTITGPATSAGMFSLFMLNETYNIDVDVSSGDTVAAIAAAVVAAVPAEFPYDAVATATGVTFTAKNAGTVGNYLNPVYNWRGLSNVSPLGVGVTVARTTAGSGVLDPIDYEAALGECCYNCYAPLTADLPVQRALQKWLESSWDCTKPQCFGHAYVWNEGTLGQVLATGTNAAVFNRLAYPLNDPNPPYFLAAHYAALSCCTACDNPELNIQGTKHGVLSCVARPATCSQPWSLSDRKALKAAGFVTWGPASMGASNLTHPMIYEDITNYLYDNEGRPNVTFRSTSMRRWAQSFGTEFAAFLETEFDGLSFFQDGTRIREGVYGTNKNLAYGKIVAWLREQEGSKISQIINLDKQVKLVSDMDTAPKCKGTPGAYKVRLIVGPPIRASRFSVDVQPKLLDNCDR